MNIKVWRMERDKKGYGVVNGCCKRNPFLLSLSFSLSGLNGRRMSKMKNVSIRLILWEIFISTFDLDNFSFYTSVVY